MKKEGHWITTKTGRHVFIEDGKTVEQALAEAFDNDKEYYYHPNAAGSATSISKEEYELYKDNENYKTIKVLGSELENYLRYELNMDNKVDVINDVVSNLDMSNYTSFSNLVTLSGKLAGISYYDGVLRDYLRLCLIPKWEKEVEKRLLDIENMDPTEYINNKQSASLPDGYANNQFKLNDEFTNKLAGALFKYTTLNMIHSEQNIGKDKLSTFFTAAGNKISLNPIINNGIEYQKGQVISHEFYHAVDCIYGGYSGYLSVNFKLSNGKTLHEILTKEGMGKPGEILRKKMEEDYYKEKKPYFEEYDKLVEEFGYDDPKVNEVWKKCYKEWTKINRKKWGDVSDIYCGSTKGKHTLCGMGHSTSYFNRSREYRALEFFAEYCSAKSCNKDSFDLIQKYYPETSKAAEEILDYINNNIGEFLWK